MGTSLENVKRGQSPFPGRDSPLFTYLMLLDKFLSGYKIIYHNNGRSPDFAEHIMDADSIHGNPHDDLIDNQPADAQNQKHQKFSDLIRVFIRIKDILDAEDIVYDNRNGERTAAGYQIIDMGDLRQEYHDPVIDKKAQKADKAEFDNLFY